MPSVVKTSPQRAQLFPHACQRLKDVVRCAWANNELPFAITMRNGEVPVHEDRVLFEFLILEGAQAGLSWNTILKKRENYRRAFDGIRSSPRREVTTEADREAAGGSRDCSQQAEDRFPD